jgi:hypothetical protein
MNMGKLLRLKFIKKYFKHRGTHHQDAPEHDIVGRGVDRHVGQWIPVEVGKLLDDPFLPDE